MYQVDSRDRVVPLEDVPQSSVGAPIPFVMADEHRVVLAYYVENRPPQWDGSEIRLVGPTSSDEPIAIIRFSGCRAHMSGPPNNEAFAGHPLASRGLHPYGTFLIQDSSWIRKLESMNSIHRSHRPDSFRSLRHLVFAFHDSTFECICNGFDSLIAQGSIPSVIPRMAELLWQDYHVPPPSD